MENGVWSAPVISRSSGSIVSIVNILYSCHGIASYESLGLMSMGFSKHVTMCFYSIGDE